MKRQVYTELHAGLGAAERQAIELMVESFNRPDFAEGVQSYLERRDPDVPPTAHRLTHPSIWCRPSA